MNTADLLIDAKGSEIQHRTGLTAPDAFFYLRVNEQDIVFFDAREYGIQKKHLEQQGRNVAIKELEPYIALARSNKQSLTMNEKLLLAILKDHDIDSVRISPNVPYKWILSLQNIYMPFEVYDFSTEQICKSSQEIEYLKEAQKITNGAFDVARIILQKSTIVDENVLLDDVPLTCETIKQAIQIYFLEHNYSCPESLIVASKGQTARPHDEGSGVVFANEPIIIDLFPRNNATGYFADMTRTFVKGTPSDAFVKQYKAVQIAQQAAIDCAAVGKSCGAVHTAVLDSFEQSGYVTSNGEGFIHGTGHGLGLQVHEAPSINNNAVLLEPGMVITIEPGLYYSDTGGVRIEDVLVFHPDGTKENINTYPKDFDFFIIP